jgi:pyruvate dehydrogenase E1 component alpha subunit
MTQGERALALYRTMARIRAFENAAEEASKGGVSAFGAALSNDVRVRGPLHLSTGQEAVPAGVCIHLTHEDLLTSTHRGHGHTLAKGASMHIADFSVGMLGANGVVAAGIPIAVGAAHALKLRGSPKLIACFFGDGAINRGPFLEGLNWAKIYGLPVLFVCEDNRWSATTSTDAMTAGGGPLARAKAIGIDGIEVDGNDVLAVDAAASSLIAKIRSGAGPQFLHAITYRFKGHVSVDPATYRDGEEVARALESDPISLFREKLSRQDIEKIEVEVQAEVSKALETAAAAPWPDKRGAYTDIQDTGSGRWLG